MQSLLGKLAAVLGVAVVAATAAAAAYIFWFSEKDSSPNAAPNLSSTTARVTAVAISNEIDSNGLPVNPRLVLPAGSRAVRATVALTGVKVGMKVRGVWYQLGTASAGAEGAEISSSEITLTQEQVLPDATAALSFSLGTNGPPLPADAWLLRIFVDGVLVKTSAFIITPGVP